MKFQELNELIKTKKKELSITIPRSFVDSVELKSTRNSEMEEEVENENEIETKEEKKFNELKIGESMIRIEEEVFGNNDSSKIINLKPSLYDDEIISKTEFKFNESTLSTLIVKNETITTLNEKYTVKILEKFFFLKLKDLYN